MLTAVMLMLLAPWKVVEKVDPIDDSTSVYAVTGDQARHVAMGCERAGSGVLRVSIKFGRYMGDALPGVLAGGEQLQYRFDDRPAETVFWYSHDDTVSAEAERTRPTNFIQAARGTSKLVVRAADGAGDDVDMMFAYDDPAPQIDAMMARCRKPAG